MFPLVFGIFQGGDQGAFAVAQGSRFLIFLIADGAFFFLRGFRDILGELLENRGACRDQQSRAAARLVNDVHRLVGEKSVRDVLVRQPCRSHDRFFGKFYPMMGFVFVA
ncbi:MAG: hypothetical protein BWX80_03022 [Candidatus Hydrogenedentes bacterium ADurb.Bin101]|nr:MAG: hypothetical protein BWX80_03022 [Candidatus Hydrogenedentes bacterium ADurb.Bin101]